MISARRHFVFPIITLILLIASVFSTTPPFVEAQANPPIDKTLFGVDLGFLGKTGSLPQDKFGLIRLWDSGVYWGALQPQPNQWDFTRMDQVVNDAAQNGIAVLYTMGQTPTWASSDPGKEIGKHVYGAGSQYPPTDIQNWRDYVRTVANRYKGKIQYYEIWNEVDSKLFWDGTVADLVKLTHEASLILRQIDPTIKVVAPSVTAGDISKGTPYLRAFLPAIKDDIDIVNGHFYPGTELIPESMVAKIAAMHAGMKASGADDKPLWDTETGFGSHNKTTSNGVKVADELVTGAKAEGFIARSYLVSVTQGVGSFVFYRWQNAAQGLNVFNDDGTPSQVYDSYGLIMTWLVGNSFQSVKTNGPIWTTVFSRPGGSLFHIVWSETGNGTFAIPTDWQATKTTVYGQPSVTPASAMLTLDDRPVMVE